MEQKGKKRLIIALVVLAVVAAVLAGVYFMTRPDAVTGEKTVSVTVDFGDGRSNTHEIQTDAEYLRGALEQEELVAGTESELGLYVLTVDGVTADESKQQWWCFTKDGEMLMTGVDTTPIADGDSFTVTLTTGW